MTYQNTADYTEKILKLLDLELNEQKKRIKQSYQSLAELKKSGYGICPVSVINRSFGFAEYPEVVFKIPLNQPIDRFRQQEMIELFSEEGMIKGAILYLTPSEGKIRLFADDFPEWMDTSAIGIRVGVDEKSMQQAKDAVQQLDGKNPFAAYLFEDKPLKNNNTNWTLQSSPKLNESQNQAVRHILSDKPLSIVHGPPGTGKTTTLVEAIRQLVNQGEKVLAVAPGNMAVDHLSVSLIRAGVNVLRAGNPAKISEELLQHTLEGKLASGPVFQELKKLKIQAEEYRKMASQYKRNFGKDEREQRKLIWEQFRLLKKEIQQTIRFYKEKWQDEAQVICGTPVGLAEELSKSNARIVVIDEAGQCLQPFAWIAIQPQVEKLVLAGDHWQLPPTVISEEASRLGLSESVLELFLDKADAVLLDTQYRMREQIASFSSSYFYEGKLVTPPAQLDNGSHLLFFDTAGTGYEEQKEEEGSSLFNTGELELIPKIIEQLGLRPSETVFISPYSGQVAKAREYELPVSRISTIDSFQGQEHHTVILSLVRSNERQEIGFLKDYRRMNVAMTRAQEQLIIIGDSATIGNDSFYKKFLDHAEQQNAYRTAWEVLY